MDINQAGAVGFATGLLVGGGRTIQPHWIMQKPCSGSLSRPAIVAVLVVGAALLAASVWLPDRAGAPDSRDRVAAVSSSDGRPVGAMGREPTPSRDGEPPMGEEISASSVFHPPSSDELEDVLSAPVEQRLVHGLRLLRQARRGNWDRADAGAFAESLFYGVVRDAGGNGSRTRDAHVGLDAGSFTRLGDAFGEWMAIDSEGSIAWLATRPIPLSSAVLEHVSAAAASGRDIDMAGWLDSFPAPIDLRTRAVWTYGGALIEALGPEQAVTELLEIPFLSPDYAFQIVTIIPGRSRD